MCVGRGVRVKAAFMMEVVALRDSRWFTPARLAYRVGSECSLALGPQFGYRIRPPLPRVSRTRGAGPTRGSIARSRPLTN